MASLGHNELTIILQMSAVYFLHHVVYMRTWAQEAGISGMDK